MLVHVAKELVVAHLVPGFMITRGRADLVNFAKTSRRCLEAVEIYLARAMPLNPLSKQALSGQLACTAKLFGSQAPPEPVPMMWPLWSLLASQSHKYAMVTPFGDIGRLDPLTCWLEAPLFPERKLIDMRKVNMHAISDKIVCFVTDRGYIEFVTEKTSANFFSLCSYDCDVAMVSNKVAVCVMHSIYNDRRMMYIFDIDFPEVIHQVSLGTELIVSVTVTDAINVCDVNGNITHVHYDPHTFVKSFFPIDMPEHPGHNFSGAFGGAGWKVCVDDESIHVWHRTYSTPTEYVCLKTEITDVYPLFLDSHVNIFAAVSIHRHIIFFRANHSKLEVTEILRLPFDLGWFLVSSVGAHEGGINITYTDSNIDGPYTVKVPIDLGYTPQ